jgi:hypothetical protein
MIRKLYQTPSQTIGRLDWAIAILSDDDQLMIVPQWSRPGGGWMMPADLPGPVPGAVLSALLEPDALIALARVVETETAARKMIP